MSLVLFHCTTVTFHFIVFLQTNQSYTNNRTMLGLSVKKIIFMIVWIHLDFLFRTFYIKTFQKRAFNGGLVLIGVFSSGLCDRTLFYNFFTNRRHSKHIFRQTFISCFPSITTKTLSEYFSQKCNFWSSRSFRRRRRRRQRRTCSTMI